MDQQQQQQAGSSSGAGAGAAAAGAGGEQRVEADDDTMEPVFLAEEDGEVVADLDEEVGPGKGGGGSRYYSYITVFTLPGPLSNLATTQSCSSCEPSPVCKHTSHTLRHKASDFTLINTLYVVTTAVPCSQDDAPMSDSDEEDEDTLRSAGGDVEDRDAEGEVVAPPTDDAVAVVANHTSPVYSCAWSPTVGRMYKLQCTSCCVQVAVYKCCVQVEEPKMWMGQGGGSRGMQLTP
jgi:hypothetical protein